ncbi:ATP-binding cassette domain-containing protein [Rickettsiales endosymbiont of Peranema trichophorum]|uniref:ABC transporter ATP-binding protein n=1 Tax=Rickettsiales endosymbiont of Peranema trichophorum TaxID=2486577 RepID=UPI00102390B2|nr:ABC transporter transmembrane domain-containing protein [Rickettsiales endosymbiont of Peranema trichophorum]RZI47274.1 ATP-binding cassette domain-containing protein [Rickettsiales endosymbiont of Peranema trichophorum]
MDSILLLVRLVKEHVSSQRKGFIIAICCMILIAMTTAINAWLLQPILDDIFVKKNVGLLYVIPCGVILNALIKGIAAFFQTAIMKRIGQKIVTDIQLRLYSHLIYADMHFLNKFHSGNLISRFTNDINAMRKILSDAVTSMTMELLTVIGLIGLMFYQSYHLACIVMLMIPIAFFPIIKLSRRMRKIAKNIQEELGMFVVRLDETFQNFRIIKSYCREEYEISRARRGINRFLELYRKASYVESASSPIMEFLGGVAVAVIVWYGGMEVISGHTTPGAFFSFIAALLMLYKPLKTLSQLNTSMQEGLSASKRLFAILDHCPVIEDDRLLPDVAVKSYDVEFQNIFFSYDDGVKILDGLNMKIPDGSTVALVGSSGAGKTTIFSLLQRLYNPDYGTVHIGGYDISKIRLSSLRGAMGLVSQDVALFDDTVKENIRYGRLSATDDDVMEAAMIAAAHDFITGLPDGYDTHIGQRGIKLSGGQKQRIAIARAILKNAPILLMDEATSALDSISEKQVQIALEYLKKGRTTITIAHRLSTIENADLIYVISNGKVSEFGTHEELMDKKGEYFELHAKYESNGSDDL